MKEEKTNLLHRVMRDGNGFCCQLFLKIGKIDRRQLSVVEPYSFLCAIKNNEKVYREKNYSVHLRLLWDKCNRF